MSPEEEDLNVACCPWEINVSLGATPRVAKNPNLWDIPFPESFRGKFTRCLCLNVI